MQKINQGCATTQVELLTRLHVDTSSGRHGVVTRPLYPILGVGLALTHRVLAIMAQDEIEPLTHQVLHGDVPLCRENTQRA
jgi:hypothetical protein